MSIAMAEEFSLAKLLDASTFVQPGRILQAGAVRSNPAQPDTVGMAALPETPEEHKARRDRQQADQRTLLEHLPAWLKLRGVSQKTVAHELGLSEGSVSSYLSGGQSMPVGVLRQIAVLLQAQPGDLLRPPEEAGVSAKVENTLQLMDALSDAEWAIVMQTARTIAEAKRRNSG